MPRIPGPRKPKTGKHPVPALPASAVLEIIARDDDGEFLATPVKWDGPGDPPRIHVAPSKGKAPGPALGIGDRFLGRIQIVGDGAIARVVKPLAKPLNRVLGQYTRQGGQGRLTPTDKKSRVSYLVARGDEGGAKIDDLVVATPLSGRQDGLQKAKIVEVVGPLDAPGAISLISIYTHGIPDGFPEAAIKEAEAAKPPTLKGRTDLRKLPLVTIDPDDARDHDDAVHAEPDPDHPGGWIVTVAIADVAAYVTVGSVLDREAYLRGNSTYFPDRVAPMLPEALSADLCSLREGENRACMAVRMHFNADGKKTKHHFIRGLMRSAARLTYTQVQNAIDGHPDEKTAPLLDSLIKPLYAAYAVMKRGRDDREPLDLHVPERRVRIGTDGKIASIELRQSLSSMQLIEEMMIQANVAAAETLEQKRILTLFRIHDEPSREKIESLGEFLESLSIPFAKGQKLKPGLFNRFLKDQKEGPFAPLINEMVLRSQSQASYSPDNIGHFGLNLPRYAHFTSPIRRYADLIVHRGLIRALDLGKDGLKDSEIANLGEIGEMISAHERRSMTAERDAVDRYLAAFMADRIGVILDGRISGVTSFGLFIRLNETGADGLVPIRSLGNEFFRHDEGRRALVGSRSGETYALGDPVKVKLLEAAPLTGGLRFSIEEHQPMRPPQKGGKARFDGPKPNKGKRHGPPKVAREKRRAKRRR
ncbi:Ribonuclease R [Alphaproteobacteria bacterium SO-S41]|nr:Ribonuclease R [Alphaproteobacteria bacterium SO-S41]